MIIVGSGGHAKVCIDIARRTGEFELAGLLDDDPAAKGKVVAGLEVLGGRELLTSLISEGVTHGFCAIGHNAFRLDITQHLLDAGFEVPILKHPSAVVGDDVTVGVGTVFVAGSVVNPCCRLGMACLINTCCSVDHDNELGDAVHICPGVHLGGTVRVGDRTQIGIGASVLPNITIGKDVVIGGGAVVLRNVPDGCKFVGVPARPI